MSRQPLTMREGWERVAALLENHYGARLTPADQHNLKLMWYTGFRDMISLMGQLAATMPQEQAVGIMTKLFNESVEFFEPEAVGQRLQAAAAAEQADRKLETELRSILDAIFGAEQAPSAEPAVPPATSKKHLH